MANSSYCIPGCIVDCANGAAEVLVSCTKISFLLFLPATNLLGYRGIANTRDDRPYDRYRGRDVFETSANDRGQCQTISSIKSVLFDLKENVPSCTKALLCLSWGLLCRVCSLGTGGHGRKVRFGGVKIATGCMRVSMVVPQQEHNAMSFSTLLVP